MKKILLLGFTMVLFGLGAIAQVQDTLVLFAGGPNYILRKTGYVSSAPIEPCSTHQTDVIYNNAVGLNLYYSKKTNVGDTTRFLGLKISDTYSLRSSVPIKESTVIGFDTILASQPTVGTVEIVEQYKTLQPYILITNATQTGDIKSWTQILCDEKSTETIRLKYRVVVENRPKLVSPELKLCASSPVIDLFNNVDKLGGVFSIVNGSGPITAASPLASSLFDPSKYATGKYTIYYKKKYDNDTTNSTFLSFSIDLGASSALSIVVNKDTIPQGDFVSFQAKSTLITGDQVASTEWDFGDKTSISKLESPLHYYLETGAMTVTVKQSTKFGCTQTVSRKAVFVKPILVDTNAVVQVLDTLVLYAGGPNYVLKKAGYTSTSPIEPCSYYQTDVFYDNAVSAHLAISKKTNIGDVTYMPGPHTSKNYSLRTLVPVKAGKVLGYDTILTQQATKGSLEIVQQSKILQPYILVSGPVQIGNYKAWTKIICKETLKEASPFKYFIIIENKPKAINSDFKVCLSSSLVNLAVNVDNPGGTFSIAKSADPISSAVTLPNGLFDPKNYALGKYTVYYRKSYDNDISNATLLSFSLDLIQGNNTLSLKADKDTIQQGEAVSFQATSTLLSGDVITTTEWDFGDKTPTSKVEKPFHYYLDTGAITVTVKQATKLGCLQSASKKALYVKAVKIDIKTEANGPFEFSYEDKKENYLRLYPNPVKSTVHFTAYVSLGKTTLSLRRVLDAAVVFEKEYPWLESTEIDMSSYASGLYLLQVKPASGEEKHFKIIKE